MSEEQASATPLVDLLRSIPIDFRAQWPIQWFEDGTPSGHASSSVGKHAHDAAEQIEQLQAALTELVRLKDLRDKGFENNDALKKYREEKPLAWDVARKVLGVDQNG